MHLPHMRVPHHSSNVVDPWALRPYVTGWSRPQDLAAAVLAVMGVAPGAAEPQRSLADMGIDSMQQVARAGPAHALALHSAQQPPGMPAHVHRGLGACHVQAGGSRIAAHAFVKTLRATARSLRASGPGDVRPAGPGGDARCRGACCPTLTLPHARASLGPAALRLTRGAAAQVEVRALVQRALGRPFPLEQARAPAPAADLHTSTVHAPCPYANAVVAPCYV
jgi:hypothetical protein